MSKNKANQQNAQIEKIKRDAWKQVGPEIEKRKRAEHEAAKESAKARLDEVRSYFNEMTVQSSLLYRNPKYQLGVIFVASKQLTDQTGTPSYYAAVPYPYFEKGSDTPAVNKFRIELVSFRNVDMVMFKLLCPGLATSIVHNDANAMYEFIPFVTKGLKIYTIGGDQTVEHTQDSSLLDLILGAIQFSENKKKNKHKTTQAWTKHAPKQVVAEPTDNTISLETTNSDA